MNNYDARIPAFKTNEAIIESNKSEDNSLEKNES